jgi:rhodanese-related sulfurtransferase
METEEGCRELSPRECFLLFGGPEPDRCIILDVRTPSEFSEGHLEGAENLDYYRPDFKEKITERDKTRRYLVYCRKGIRGKKTMEFMRECGFRDVININGGFENWMASGLPVHK